MLTISQHHHVYNDLHIDITIYSYVSTNLCKYLISFKLRYLIQQYQICLMSCVTGTTATFRAYGLMCGVVLAAFIFINFYRIDTGFISELPVTEDPHQVFICLHYFRVNIVLETQEKHLLCKVRGIPVMHQSPNSPCGTNLCPLLRSDLI